MICATAGVRSAKFETVSTTGSASECRPAGAVRVVVGWHVGPFCRITQLRVRFHRIDLLESINWVWGLSLIALTTAIHTMGVVMMSVVGIRIRATLEARNLGLQHVIPIVIGVVAAAGLLLAALHGIEAAIWAAAYV